MKASDLTVNSPLLNLTAGRQHDFAIIVRFASLFSRAEDQNFSHYFPFALKGTLPGLKSGASTLSGTKHRFSSKLRHQPHRIAARRRDAGAGKESGKIDHIEPIIQVFHIGL